LYLWGLSEDNHRHWSRHGVGDTGLIDVAELAGTLWGWHCARQQNYRATAVLQQATYADALSQSHSLQRQPSASLTTQAAAAWRRSVQASRLPEWQKLQIFTLKWTSSPSSLVKTLLCSACYLQGQRKQMA